MVGGVAEHVGALAAAVDGEGDVAGGVTGRGDGGHLAGQRSLAFDEVDQAGVEHGGEHVVIVGALFELVGAGPEVPLGLLDDVAGVGEERLGFAVDVGGVPAGVVEVEVGEGDDVDLVGGDAGFAHHLGQGGGRLQRQHFDGASADAAVDEDGASLADDQPGAEVEDDVAVVVEQVAVGVPVGGLGGGEESGGGHDGPGVLERDQFGVADIDAVDLSHCEPP